MERLRDFLARVAAAWNGSEWLAPCPFWEVSHPDGSKNPRKVVISKGEKYPVIAHCRVCGREATGRIYAAWALPNHLARCSSPEEIDAAWAGVEQPPEPGDVRAASYDELNEVYRELLRVLFLDTAHAQWLAAKGLKDAFALGYRSTPSPEGDSGQSADDVANLVFDAFGAAVARVPGFAIRRGELRLLTRPRAVLIPCRDARGRIFALKQRMLDGKGARLRLLSSRPVGGPKALVRCHVPLGVGDGRHRRLWVTEGERKADVHWELRGEPTVGVPGVSAWATALSVAAELLVPGGEVVVAMDRDAAGEQAKEKLIAAAVANGYAAAEARWAGAKGLDDAVLKQKKVEFSRSETRATPPDFVATDATESVPGVTASGFIRDPVAYLEHVGPQLRDALGNHYEVGLHQGIKSGRVRMAKTRKGQVVAGANVDEQRWRTFLSEVEGEPSSGTSSSTAAGSAVTSRRSE
jgi:hypothetical protein